LFTGGLFLCLAPFLWGKVSDPLAGPLLSVCCDGLLFFNFAKLFGFGCCSLAQEMSFVDHYLPYFRHWFSTHLLLALLPFQHLFTEVCSEISSLPLPPFSGAFSEFRSLLLCASFQFLVYCSVFLFFVCGRVSLPRGLCWFVSGLLGEYRMTLGTHLLVC
jgi:hypothetical protein